MKRFVAAFLVLLICAGCAPTQQPEKSQTEAAPQEEESLSAKEQTQPEQETAQPEEEAAQPEQEAAPVDEQETLLVTTTAYANGQNDDDGIDLIVYAYDEDTQTLAPVFRKDNYIGMYPANTVDFTNQIVYYADARPGEYYDNLYAYDLQTGRTRQLTDGKNSFNDLLLVDGTLYANVAREYATTCQPARFDFDTQTFTYRNENDDDTWHHSFSYDSYADAFLILTCSDTEMRTQRVAAETHIRPKTISLIDKTFETVTPLFFTEDYEVRVTRRLDEDTILMTADPRMAEGPRTMKRLDIDTQQVEEFEIPGIYTIYQFYPTADGKTLYLIAKPSAGPGQGLYRFEMDTQVLTQRQFPEQTRQIVDLQITRQICGPDPALVSAQDASLVFPNPRSEQFDLSEQDAVLFDAAVAAKNRTPDDTICIPEVSIYGTYEEDGQTVAVCHVYYRFYYGCDGTETYTDYGAMQSPAKAVLTRDEAGKLQCASFTLAPDGAGTADWAEDFCGPLSELREYFLSPRADDAWTLTNTMPSSEELFRAYLSTYQEYA